MENEGEGVGLRVKLKRTGERFLKGNIKTYSSALGDFLRREKRIGVGRMRELNPKGLGSL